MPTVSACRAADVLTIRKGSALIPPKHLEGLEGIVFSAQPLNNHTSQQQPVMTGINHLSQAPVRVFAVPSEVDIYGWLLAEFGHTDGPSLHRAYYGSFLATAKDAVQRDEDPRTAVIAKGNQLEERKRRFAGLEE